MSPKQTRKGNTKRQAIEAPDGEAREESAVGNSSHDEEIRRRAYEIYLERGAQPGAELDDWVQAEREFQRGGRSHEQAG
jgi:hypothetical protein